jgi:hypothetical protein
MTRIPIVCFVAGLLSVVVADISFADVLFESGTLGPTGIFIDQIMGDGIHPGGAVVSPVVFDGVRFELTQGALTTSVGGHFVGYPSGDKSLFAAIVRLDNGTDFPNSGDLSTPDVLGHALLAFPNPSAEVFGGLNVHLDPGWYALVFGSGLFGATGRGAALLNNPDIGAPTYFAYEPGIGWFDTSAPNGPFQNYRLAVDGNFVPEPNSAMLVLVAVVVILCSVIARHCGKKSFTQ